MAELLRYKEIDYTIRQPENFDQNKQYPLVIYLHGAGGRGRDVNVILNHDFYEKTEVFCKDAITAIPQCYANTWFDMFEQLKEFICAQIDLPYVEKARVYRIGASMGGYGTWQMGMSIPEKIAAIVPICGGGMYWNAERLKHTGVWAFHGDIDATVSCEESKKMVAKINGKGGNARLTIYESTGHNAWDPTFKSEEMWTWLFSQRNHYQQTTDEYNDVVKFG